jgi:pyrimidine-specific ribonucleoside hydrolase
METGDPDDLFTLFLLCGHPQVQLKAVNVTPGSPDQVGLVKRILSWFDLDLPVGAFNIDHEKRMVSDWYREAYGDFPDSREARPGYEIIREHCTQGATLITGGPLRNLGTAIRLGQEQNKPLYIERWVGQGGFAGKGVVPPDKQLPQFKGLVTSPTTNFNKHPGSAKLALSCQGITHKYLVSKNVCHGVYYDQDMHQVFAELKDKSLSHSMIWKGMEAYLRAFPEGKKFHDPLTACCAIDESIGIWEEVEVYKEEDKWGSRLSPGSATWITIDYDHELFVRTLTATK